MKITLILFFFLTILISCNNTQEEKTTLCSYENPNGKCEEGLKCINGKCIYTCNENKKCPENFKCDNNICFDTTQKCSKSNPFGKCNKNETCIDGVCKNLLPCTEDNPKGICSSENRICYKGICVEKTDECRPWNITGKCPQNYYCNNGYCKHKKVYPPCSPNFPEGKCLSSSDTCINGICYDKELSCNSENTSLLCPDGQICINGKCYTDSSKPCDENNYFGYCENSLTCYFGKCYDKNAECSTDNPIGKCPEGQYCNEGECKLILDECDTDNPCPDTQRQYCDNHICKDKEIFCSQENIKGLCPEGKTCVNGNCEKITVECSLSNLDGKCENINLKCINGKCLDTSQENVCNENNINGKCPEGSACDNGICSGNIKSYDIGHSCIIDEECNEGLFCQKTFLDGYCTKECNNDSDCDDSSTCYNLGNNQKYCLAKCSVNIPNSCARENQENYICYPTENNNGVCLYDCKYNNCFNTGKTCNTLTGYCQ